MAAKGESTRDPGEEQSITIGMGFCANALPGNAAVTDIKDGKIVRIRPLHYDWKYDPEEFNPWEMKVRGTSFKPLLKSTLPPYSIGYKKRVYSPNRVRYPLKRVDWDPNGERNPQNRGSSKFVRISWDEALDIIVSEIKRVHKAYGPYGILCQGDGHGEDKIVHASHGCNTRLLEHLGGYTYQIRNTDSWEGWWWGAKHVWGMEPLGQMSPLNNVMLDMAENTELILFWGCDPETTPWAWNGQMASRLCYWFGDLGIKQTYICPDVNYGAAVHGDKWIPIRPNTDAALQLAIAYQWFKNGTYDKKYLETHAYGVDKFEAYVTGEEDGVPKTPEWAAAITGVPSRTIKSLASEWASKRTSIAHSNGGGYIRGPYATEPARLEVLLLAMQGLGKPGAHQVKMFEWNWLGPRLFFDLERTAMPRAVAVPTVGAAYRGWSFLPWNLKFPKQIIPKTLIPEAILNPPISWYSTTMLYMPRSDQFKEYVYPVEGCSEIHMVWTDSPSWITCWNSGNKFIEAMKSPKIEFMLAQHPWLENDCLFADIVLPVSTKFELSDIGTGIGSGDFETIFTEPQCIDPVGESKSDYEIVCMIAERFGLLDKVTEGKSIDDWIKYGWETSGVQDLVSWEQLKDKGYYVVPTDKDWEDYPRGMAKFHEDPAGNPLTTPTGKIEFYATGLAEHFPDDEERPPVPHYIAYGVSHQESLSHPRAEKYPLLVMSNHPRWSVHSQHEDITWLREIDTCKVRGADGYQYHPLWISAKDADERGIKKGDIVKLFNDRGGILCGAYITERIMPGVVGIDHGAKYDPIVPGELDRGGAENTICPSKTTSKNAAGHAVSGFLVEVEKVDLEALRTRYPEALARPFHPDAGPFVEGFLE